MPWCHLSQYLHLYIGMENVVIGKFQLVTSGMTKKKKKKHKYVEAREQKNRLEWRKSMQLP